MPTRRLSTEWWLEAEDGGCLSLAEIPHRLDTVAELTGGDAPAFRRGLDLVIDCAARSQAWRRFVAAQRGKDVFLCCRKTAGQHLVAELRLRGQIVNAARAAFWGDDSPKALGDMLSEASAF